MCIKLSDDQRSIKIDRQMKGQTNVYVYIHREVDFNLTDRRLSASHLYLRLSPFTYARFSPYQAVHLSALQIEGCLPEPEAELMFQLSSIWCIQVRQPLSPSMQDCNVLRCPDRWKPSLGTRRPSWGQPPGPNDANEKLRLVWRLVIPTFDQVCLMDFITLMLYSVDQRYIAVYEKAVVCSAEYLRNGCVLQLTIWQPC